MADISRVRTSSSSSKSNRLQRRRPATLEINPPSWNVAIPLLSPLITSPEDRIPILKSQDEKVQRNQVVEAEKGIVFKKWQHPAAPFCYETPQFAPSFSVPV
ncbi:hypothetical protein M5689_005968 [Euphorbia peplus]|nr:hypothetical protein M5689_005968 [Euphorbia peplus]